MALVALVSTLLSTAGTDLANAQSKHAAMIIDANSGETLYADKADETRFPASLTKMMTLYMVFEQLEKGRLTPASKIKISQEAANAQPTKLDLEPGEQIAVMDAIKALITKSANDMAIALAESIGGTEAQFAELMTAKARAIGMRNTKFVNASGLPDTRQVTTAHDMLILALRLQDDFPKYFPLFALRSFTYSGSTYRNHNTMLNSFEGIDGIKTGYTRMSGFNLVTSLRRGDKHLVGAVFGGTTAGTRNLTMRLLLTRALLKASTKKTRKAAPVLVARAKPAVRPAPAPAVAAAKPQPQPQQFASAQPAKSPSPAALSAPAAAQTVSVAAATEAAAPAVEAAPIEIARVRPVMVAPRVRRNAFVIQPAPEPPAGPTEAESPAVADAASAALEEVAPPPMVAPIRPTVAQAPPQRIASVAAVPKPIAQTVAAITPTAPLRGTLPSTLQAQAQNLGRGVPPSAALAAQPVAYAAAVAPSRPRGIDLAPANSGFHIQVGAYASATEAERVLRETQARANGLLKTAMAVTAPVQKENRMLYRARFAGFSAQTAASTCLELRRAAIDCFVMKAE